MSNARTQAARAAIGDMIDAHIQLSAATDERARQAHLRDYNDAGDRLEAALNYANPETPISS